MGFLDDAFLAQWSDSEVPSGASSGPPSLATVSGTVVVKATGGPDGNVAASLIFESGVVTSATAGSTRGAALTLEAPWQIAADMICGGDDPARHYMAGDLKVSGDMSLWLELLVAWRAAGTLGVTNHLDEPE